MYSWKGFTLCFRKRAIFLIYESQRVPVFVWIILGNNSARIKYVNILIRSNKMQQYAGIYLLQNHSLHVSGVHRIHHQEYVKL